jgi:hypothetical protein
MDRTTFTIVQPMADQSRYYFAAAIGEHEGFRWGKSDIYQLYHIVPVDGKVMPYSLSSKFTKLSELIKTIDAWIKENGSIDALPDYVEPKSPRSHHKKNDKKETLFEDHTD